jgi:hypothetical protein
METPSTSVSAEITRFIEATSENDFVDAKCAMLWDGGAGSAALAKDIAAFANSRDGGVLVIGKSEPTPGHFQLDGLTREQADSFDTTKVANWVNARFSPPIRLACHRQEYDGRVFVVITISEFLDIPHICTKGFQDPAEAKKHLLKEAAIYVRTANAESAPVSGVEQLRALIGRATAKKGDELLKQFDSILRGRPTLANRTDEQLFADELEMIETGLRPEFQKAASGGAWTCVVHPAAYGAERWSDSTVLEGMIHRNAVRLRDEFPPHYRGTHMREWGICNDLYGDIWTLARSGQLLYVRPYYENTQTYECKWRGPDGKPTWPDFSGGEWIDYKQALFTITEIFMFLTRFIQEYGAEDSIQLTIKATALSGRKLATTDFLIHLPKPEPCRAQSFEFTKRIGVEEFRAEWEDLAAQTMKRFVELFAGPADTLKVMRGWVQKFKDRQF